MLILACLTGVVDLVVNICINGHQHPCNLVLVKAVAQSAESRTCDYKIDNSTSGRAELRSNRQQLISTPISVQAFSVVLIDFVTFDTCSICRSVDIDVIP